MKKFISYIICIILVIIIIVANTLYILANTVLNQNYILEVLEDNHYYEKTYNNIKSSFSQYILQSGLDEDIINNLYTKEQIKEHVNIVISNIYTNEKQKVDTNKIKMKIETNIENYLKANKIELNNVQKESVDKFIKTIEKTYEDEISYSNYLDKIGNKVYKTNYILKKARIFVYGSIVALVVLILVINIKKFFFGISYIGVALLASGIINIITKIYINTKININKIRLINEDISLVIINIVNHILNFIQCSGLVLIGTGVILIILTNLIKNNKPKKEI